MPTTTTFQPLNDLEAIVLISGTSVDASTWAVVDLPAGYRKCRLLRVKAINSAGTAAAIQVTIARVPELGELTTELVADPIGDAADPALPLVVDEQPEGPVLAYAGAEVGGYDPLATGAGRLFVHFGPDAGADNVIAAELYIAAGWGLQ